MIVVSSAVAIEMEENFITYYMVNPKKMEKISILIEQRAALSPTYTLKIPAATSRMTLCPRSVPAYIGGNRHPPVRVLNLLEVVFLDIFRLVVYKWLRQGGLAAFECIHVYCNVFPSVSGLNV